jgi:hypothetical protein
MDQLYPRYLRMKHPGIAWASKRHTTLTVPSLVSFVVAASTFIFAQPLGVGYRKGEFVAL